MPSARRELGDRCEEAAAAHLRARGWDVVARNVLYRAGELDIVARDGDAWVFVEVRSGMDRPSYRPEDSVTLGKQRRLWRAARLYLQRAQQLGWLGSRWSARFDVIVVHAGTACVLRHHEAAFAPVD